MWKKFNKAQFSSTLIYEEGDEELEIGEEMWNLVCRAKEKGIDPEDALRRVLGLKEREFRAWEISGG